MSDVNLTHAMHLAQPHAATLQVLANSGAIEFELGREQAEALQFGVACDQVVNFFIVDSPRGPNAVRRLRRPFAFLPLLQQLPGVHDSDAIFRVRVQDPHAVSWLQRRGISRTGMDEMILRRRF